mmetsp:Transcript_44223/g.32210  ORF Transcript_44223/g.32210 Transcript_44223/m.32210 type:complete len:487 (-) Transcript_44223:184-1644(-)|eukprot:CAMPEP_0202971892 /NCGR_PEP_ID=MMETSP1396-20130829/31978_1 /ASSEMBLY_ACC=CAM_ASM_000872 /TAXON_ID= /ORGANISM="Pseudokeronopsis sp., Strain Brazil" /LENGTH=486 /DNA_ID=CAMNT_0049701757 /DNA_START=43 /DNA_END=1503 /DNA_ORIENTATION=+
MRFLLCLLAIVAPVLLVALDFPVEEGVIVLGDDNFDAAIGEFNNILVEFYAPWCGHCKSLAPEYAKAAQALADSPVKLAKVDATAHNAVAQKFEVKGFPTLKFFKNGKASDYNGGRTEKEIVSWLEKKTGPAFHVLSTESDLEKFREAHEVFALGVFTSSESAEAKAFVAAAESDEQHVYAISTDAGVRSKLGAADNTVVVLKTFDDLRNDLAVSSETASADIAKFVTTKATPWVFEFSAENSKTIFSNPITKHVLFFTDRSNAHHATTLAAYREVAQQHQGDLLFVNVPSSENKVLSYFEISPDSLPAMVIADLGSESGILKFRFNGASHSAADVNAFVSSYKRGEVKPHLKSEEPEEADTTGDVTVVKGKSFGDLVINNDRDVFVEFYAPWCGHCKQLAPIWEELGKKYSAHKDKVVIAKMDATANEVQYPGVSVRGFPTLLFFKAHEKGTPIKYEDKRELDSLIAFVEENAHHAEAVSSKDEL